MLERDLKHRIVRRGWLAWSLLASSLMAASALAGADDLSDPEFRAEVAKKFPGVEPENFSATPVEGIYQISQGGVVGYVTADGRYLLDGDLIDLDTDTNLAENARQAWRLEKIAAVDEADMLVFGPENPEYTVTVFTDVDCGYCRVMHANLDEFLSAGIRVRYLFFPLDGPGSEAYKKAQAVWCADDRKQALTRAKRGKSIAMNTSCENPIDEQFKLAWETLKLRGTPSLITDDGRLLRLTQPMSGVIGQITQPGKD